MNLNQEPTEAQLRVIIARCDDSLSHALWVSRKGDVNIQAFRPNESPALWQIINEKDIQFRCELILAGEGKVGSKGSMDKNWIRKLFHTLVINWEKKNSGYTLFV